MTRSISFTIDGEVDTQITVTEHDDGTLRFDLTVLGSGSLGDLRAIFFDLQEFDVLSTGLVATGTDVTNQVYGEGSIDRTSGDANVKGEVTKDFGQYDAGIEFGTSGLSQDDIQSTSFVLSHDSVALSLDMLSSADFGIRYTSVGTDADGRNGSEKTGAVATGVAQDDAFSVAENATGSASLLANDDSGSPDTLHSFTYQGVDYLAGERAAIVIDGLNSDHSQ